MKFPLFEDLKWEHRVVTTPHSYFIYNLSKGLWYHLIIKALNENFDGPVDQVKLINNKSPVHQKKKKLLFSP